MDNSNYSPPKITRLKTGAWKVIEPPAELTDRVPHTFTQQLSTDETWSLMAARRRGKAHEHKGRFCEDAFALGSSNRWHFMVVCDGGGSRRLSRVGAKIAAETAVHTMQEVVAASDSDIADKQIAQNALQQGLIQAWEAVSNEAKRREVPLRELGTTFLSVVYCTTESGCLVGVLQVGDGIVAAKVGSKVLVLVEPDMGEGAGSTLFLTSFPWQEWLDRISIGTLPEPPAMLVAMCDGVANDFMPFPQYLPKLFDYLAALKQEPEPAEALLELLGYEKRGSYDDRTLAMLYR